MLRQIRVERLVVAVMAALLGSSSSAFAQAEEAVPVSSLRETAAVLARSGAAHNDARTVLAAAHIMITAERTSPGLERVSGPSGGALRPEEERKLGELTAAGLLRLASRIAVEQLDVATADLAAALAADSVVGLGDPRLAEELEGAAEALAATRGRVSGPIWADGHLAAGDVVEFKLKFEGGRVPNLIKVSASNYDGDLDCYLFDGDRLASHDDRYRSDCSIEWSQNIEGQVILRVRNTGAATYYVLVSN
jgi:hypothetical protein